MFLSVTHHYDLLICLDACKKIVGAFSHSSKRRLKLEGIQAELNLPSHSLIMDCSTRWNSMYSMMVRLLEQQDAVKRVLMDDRKTAALVVNWYETMESLKEVTSALKDFAALTDALSGEKHVTISSVLPLLHHISSLADSAEPPPEDEDNIDHDIKETIADYIIPRYADPKMQQLLAMCTTLDPRYKDYMVGKPEYDTARQKILLEMEELATSVNGGLDSAAASSSSVQTSALNPKPSLGELLNFITVSSHASEPLSTVESVTKEFELYISSPALPLKSTTGYNDPLAWWAKESSRFPTLSKLSAKYLCCCATSVSSERLFSKSGNIISLKRNKLSPKMANMLTFLASN